VHIRYARCRRSPRGSGAISSPRLRAGAWRRRWRCAAWSAAASPSIAPSPSRPEDGALARERLDQGLAHDARRRSRDGRRRGGEAVSGCRRSSSVATISIELGAASRGVVKRAASITRSADDARPAGADADLRQPFRRARRQICRRRRVELGAIGRRLDADDRRRAAAASAAVLRWARGPPTWRRPSATASRSARSAATTCIYAANDGAFLNRPVLDVERGYVLTPMRRGIRLTTGAGIRAPRDDPPSSAHLDRLEPFGRGLLPALGAAARFGAVAR